MKGIGEALAYGAVSILNAMATGKGGAISIDLCTRARVTLRDGRDGFSGFVTSDPRESSKLVAMVAERTVEYYGHQGKLSGEVITSSNIPIAVGLKSSSAAANATALATASALGEEPDDDALVNIGAETSVQCGVSLTGAYDDSYASYHGGGVITDNLRRKVEKHLQVPEGLRILILVPPRKTHTGSLLLSRFTAIRRMVDLAYREASDGQLWDALTLNGLAYASVLSEDQHPALAALEAGALGAGLSGKGPAVVAIVEEALATKVRVALSQFEGKILETVPNRRKAMIES